MFSRPATSLPSDDLQVAQVGHQEQGERPAVLLVSDTAAAVKSGAKKSIRVSWSMANMQ